MLTKEEDYGYHEVHITPIDGQELAAFIDNCNFFGQTAIAEMIAERLTHDLIKIHLSDFRNMMFPLLRGLTTCLPKQTLASPPYRTLFRLTLAKYLERFLGSQQRPPLSWMRSHATCPKTKHYNKEMASKWQVSGGCSDCKVLNTFLEHPHYRHFTWKIAKDRHSHLRDAIWHGKVDCKAESIKLDKNYRFFAVETLDTFQKDQTAWQSRHAEAQDQLESLGKAVLGDILSNEFDEAWNISKYCHQETREDLMGKTRDTQASHDFENSAEFHALQQASRTSHSSSLGQPVGDNLSRHPLAHASANAKQAGSTAMHLQPMGAGATTGPSTLKRTAQTAEIIDLTDDKRSRR